MKKCNILKVNICVTNMKELLKFIDKHLKEVKGEYLCFSNVHTTVMAEEEEEYLKVQNSSLLSLPDGGPLSVIAKKKGFKEAERVTGPDFMMEIFKVSQEKGYSHFFYGSTQETLDELKSNLKNKFPELNIVGMISPPFRSLTEEENIKITNDINKRNPDFLWVGLGAPKQEIWMYNHKNKINSLMVGVGAGFDYHANKIQRAPLIMQKYSLEWLYRLIQDPKRLFKRYLQTNTKFIFYILRDKISRRMS
ncbi:glycosyl transferase [Priestia megaterium]|uniref:WecB/TagA/CpsF family glycosyltransferase n=1 Tax=Priestia TaxID=2800373 RepID=UPI000BFCCEB8|nr:MULTISPECIES: WecB/TagA/CpsF family glycosyltransferase [Priestia]MDP9724760.1 N-acetylglucosaminyldiphosphoundecaprenol N-acetyl-beta-D-mannosaminyltransferase [Priestia aryabhattai]MED3989023.1 WecB/TagA/CpsF family glycosyltransferase [Priestia aryabhattai]PGR27213.1 glycosyl transferase [Priestia megaterium]